MPYNSKHISLTTEVIELLWKEIESPYPLLCLLPLSNFGGYDTCQFNTATEFSDKAIAIKGSNWSMGYWEYTATIILIYLAEAGEI